MHAEVELLGLTVGEGEACGDVADRSSSSVSSISLCLPCMSSKLRPETTCGHTVFKQALDPIMASVGSSSSRLICSLAALLAIESTAAHRLSFVSRRCLVIPGLGCGWRVSLDEWNRTALSVCVLPETDLLSTSRTTLHITIRR